MDRTNYGSWPNMREAIEAACPGFDVRKLRPMLWKDEVGDVMILTHRLECYVFSKTRLRAHYFAQMAPRQKCAIQNLSHDLIRDDTMYAFTCDLAKLTSVIAIGGGFKKRPRLNGAFLLGKRRLLGHEFIPYGPEDLLPEVPGEVPPQFRKPPQNNVLVLT